jgi:ATP-dependent RNA helicase MSS116, mitochondrial
MHRMKQRVPDVLVATPGRLVDLLENEGLDVMLRSLRVLVYDEADQCKYHYY